MLAILMQQQKLKMAKKEIDTRDAINQPLKIGDAVVFMPPGKTKGNLLHGKVTRFAAKSAAIAYIKYYDDVQRELSATIPFRRIAKIDDEAYVAFMMMSGGKSKF